ncbi:hypothetical protein ACFYXH_41695 [Streptomyces sp. NPDC002730]|uniref:hypothetical protein n=1 Tax=Streptomyces sp. NPDC002730 TaxID=3364662 RepID=UPI00367D62B0
MALAVLYRWYSFYETDDKDFDHQGELLTDDFVMVRPREAGMPDSSGRHAYLESLRGAYAGQSNAHHLRGIEVSSTGERTATATVNYDFQTHGPQLNGAALLRYDLELVQDPAEHLPRLTRVAEQILARQEAPFQAAYTNRARAFVHYWLSLLEQPATDAEPLRELLADDVSMHLSDGRTLSAFGEIAAWYTTTVNQVDISTHRISDFKITAEPGGDYHLTMDFAWQGVTRAGQPMTARTHHQWTLQETGEWYLRLLDFKVTTIEPFTETTAEQALTHHLDTSP